MVIPSLRFIPLSYTLLLVKFILHITSLYYNITTLSPCLQSFSATLRGYLKISYEKLARNTICVHLK